ncbi:hypothetical protein LZ480_06705 [Solibacillus sp. MA9]|uniref:DUF4825 domain-containing protein n=1 Tax=Solibacillus palustris TaxID=2908203 RepID=A0ABS9UB57_9BACL|nr:hypothetical protein [Solibacillus sp. MA9]MCH7321581.1 hypothetical protein [Solibacillus sp. MA9]
MKKILTVFSLLLVMILSACSSLSNDELIKDYVKDTYGIDIVVKDSYKNSLELGEDSYIVAPVDHQEMEFSVVVYDNPTEDEINYKSEHFIKDNYLNALEADKELHKLDKVIPDINKLGFDESFNDENRVFIGEVGGKKAIWSSFYSTSHMELASFEEKDLDRLFELYKLVKQSGALFEIIYVSDMREPHESETFVFDMEKLKGVKTKEDFLLEMKKSNANIASLYENKKWESEKKKIENERFTFDSKYDDYWFNCTLTNGNGECTNIFVTVYFKENSLTKSNINLEKDLNAIFTLFEKTIYPKASIEYCFIEEGSDDSVRFTDYEIKKYSSTLDFINKNFK